MNIIITMAGLGQRFRDAGYNCPKYMIEVKGKTLFDWSMDSLMDYNLNVNKYVFICRKESNVAEFIKRQMEKRGVFNIEIIELDYLTDGQATTAKIGVEKCEKDEPILIYNIDTYIEPNNLKYSDLKGDGHIPCFNADGEHWSFVKEENGKVVEVVEKVRISDNCSVGAYYFKSAELFLYFYNKYYKDKDFKKEKYIAPLYNFMLQERLTITYSLLDFNVVHVLGTPKELEEFKNLK